MAAIENEHEIRIISMARSGHHGMVIWAAGCLSGPVLFHNHVNRGDKTTGSSKPRYYILDGTVAAQRACEPQQVAGENSRRPAYLLNTEDADLSVLPAMFESDAWQTRCGVSRRIVYCLFHRDPYNLFASRLRYHHQTRMVTDKMSSMWKQYAREFLGQTRYLPEGTAHVLYNDWVSSEVYRQNVAAQLGIPFSDRWRDCVTNWGGGSSFDGLKYNGSANRMPVLTRWRSLLTDPRFVELMRDDEIHALAKSMLGEDRWNREFGEAVMIGG